MQPSFLSREVIVAQVPAAMSRPFTDFLPVVSAEDEPSVRAFLHEPETAPAGRRNHVVVPGIGPAVEPILRENEPDAAERRQRRRDGRPRHRDVLDEPRRGTCPRQGGIDGPDLPRAWGAPE